MPTLDWTSLELLWLVACWPIAVACHELGHLVMGRLAGFSVVACGLGFGRPRLRWRVGETVLYASTLSGGLTLVLYPRLTPDREALLLMIAGGASANLLCAVATLAAWLGDVRHPALAAAFWVSAAMWLVSVVPLTGRVGGLPLINDATLAWRIAGGTLAVHERPGPALAQARALADFCAALGSDEGMLAFRLRQAWLEAALGDSPTASATLADPRLAGVPRRGASTVLEALLQAQLALDRDPASAEPAIACAARWATGDPLAEGLSRLQGVERLRALGRPCADEARALADHLRASDVDAQVAAADLLVLQADPPQALADAARGLVDRRGRTALPPLEQLRLSAFVAERLAERGDLEGATAYLAEARQRAASLGAELPDPDAQRRFAARWRDRLTPVALRVGAPDATAAPPASAQPTFRLAHSGLLTLSTGSLLVLMAQLTGDARLPTPGVLGWFYPAIGLLAALFGLLAIRSARRLPADREARDAAGRYGAGITILGLVAALLAFAPPAQREATWRQSMAAGDVARRARDWRPAEAQYRHALWLAERGSLDALRTARTLRRLAYVLTQDRAQLPEAYVLSERALWVLSGAGRRAEARELRRPLAAIAAELGLEAPAHAHAAAALEPVHGAPPPGLGAYVRAARYAITADDWPAAEHHLIAGLGGDRRPDRALRAATLSLLADVVRWQGRTDEARKLEAAARELERQDK